MNTEGTLSATQARDLNLGLVAAVRYPARSRPDLLRRAKATLDHLRGSGRPEEIEYATLMALGVLISSPDVYRSAGQVAVDRYGRSCSPLDQAAVSFTLDGALYALDGHYPRLSDDGHRAYLALYQALEQRQGPWRTLREFATSQTQRDVLWLTFEAIALLTGNPAVNGQCGDLLNTPAAGWNVILRFPHVAHPLVAHAGARTALA